MKCAEAAAARRHKWRRRRARSGRERRVSPWSRHDWVEAWICGGGVVEEDLATGLFFDINATELEEERGKKTC